MTWCFIDLRHFRDNSISLLGRRFFHMFVCIGREHCYIWVVLRWRQQWKLTSDLWQYQDSTCWFSRFWFSYSNKESWRRARFLAGSSILSMLSSLDFGQVSAFTSGIFPLVIGVSVWFLLTAKCL
jgi:hypothetical protein